MSIRWNFRGWYSRNHFNLLKTGCFLAVYGLLLHNAGAVHLYTLSSGNSTADVNIGSQAGMNNWSVDGQDQLKQDWLWYRIGDGAEASIDTLGCPTVVQPNAATLQMTYAGGRFSIQVVYSLTGGAPGSGAASIAEYIKIQNLTGHALDFHLFQYAGFDFPGTAELENDSQELFDLAQVNGSDSRVTAEIETGANHGVAGFTDLCLLNDAFPTSLTNGSGPSTNASWVLEWDRTIAGKGTWILSEGMSLVSVPEPSSASLSLISVGVIAGWRVKATRASRARGLKHTN